MLPKMHENGDRVLIFTQFTMVLDVMEQYLKIRGHSYLRLDGSTPVQERQLLIDQYNSDDSIFLFILSTKAGGLGINLTYYALTLNYKKDRAFPPIIERRRRI